jgi:cytochrome c biogenesis protein CcmG/thiol:disulfide interchange protein DsbE
MKKSALLITALLLSSCSATSPMVTSEITPGEVIGCESVSRDEKITEGIYVECLDGEQGVILGALRGPMIVNVWGSWCATCLDEMPEFRSFYAKAKGKVQLVGVDVEETNPEAGQAFVVAQGMTWPNFYDRENKSRGYFGMGVPVTWFIDESGKAVYKKIGIIESEQELIDLTREHLGIQV